MSSGSLSLPETRSNVIIQAWLQDVQFATAQTQDDSHANCRKRPLSPCPTPSRKRVALAFAHGNTMAPPKRRADNSPESASTPKRRTKPIDSDETPRATAAQTYPNSLADYPNLDHPDEPSIPRPDTGTQSSASEISRSSSPIKSLGALQMTENPVERSSEISKMPSSGRDLYKKLLKCSSAAGVLPSALKVYIIISEASTFLIARRMRLPPLLARVTT